MNGVQINANNTADFTASVTFIGDTTHGGSSTNSIITINPQVVQARVEKCGAGQTCDRNINWLDGIEGNSLPDSAGRLWNGIYTLGVSRSTGGSCEIELVQNHSDTDEDTFFDTVPHDQKLNVFFPSGTGDCTHSWNPAGPKHNKPSTPLTLSITAPSTVFVDSTFTITADADNGFGSHTYVLNADAASTSSVDFGDSSFAGTSTWNTISYSSSGTKIIAVAVKDVGSTGGNYLLKTRSIVVQEFVEDAEANGNSLSLNPTMCPDEIRAVGFVMDNTGTTDWYPASYSFARDYDSDWSPSSVSLADTVLAGTAETIWVNLQAPPFEGLYDAYYQMKHSGTFFGDSNGASNVGVDDFYCSGLLGGGEFNSELSFDPSVAWVSPDKQVTVLPLRLFQDGSGRGALNYSYAVSNPTRIDLIVRVALDPSAVRLLGVGNLPSSANAQAGTRGSREYWIRISGVVEGEGSLFQLPFELRRELTGPIGTVTIFY